tara:strand:- start:200 stop:397 length:198 start_codon:yes stop_codon:yes gene_type:complete
MNFTTEQQIWEHYSDDTITHNNINDLINDWINELQLQDSNNNLFTEQTLKQFLKTSYSNVTDWSF